MLGILGGMGPLASAEFVKTLYEFNMAHKEQTSPACVLYSDPAVPDRTEAILSGNSEGVLVDRLVKGLEYLSSMGADRIVICCVTSHRYLPSIPARLRNRVISLIDLVIEEVLAASRRYLLFSSLGTRRAGLFQGHEKWGLARDSILFPTDEDQDRIHDLIYRLKRKGPDDSIVSVFRSMLGKYETDSFVAGCTEIHLLTKELMRGEYDWRDDRIVDPLLTVARNPGRFSGPAV